MYQAEITASIVKEVCLLIRYLTMVVMLLRFCYRGNVFTEMLPSNRYTRRIQYSAAETKKTV
jgi:hypothetical protein